MYLYICFLWCINVEHEIPSKLQKPIHKDSQITRISSSHTSWVIYPWHLVTLQVAKDQYLLDVLNVAPFHLWSKSGESQLYIWSSVQHSAWWKFLSWNFTHLLVFYLELHGKTHENLAHSNHQSVETGFPTCNWRGIQAQFTEGRAWEQQCSSKP